jgi:hypothetical protein
LALGVVAGTLHASPSVPNASTSCLFRTATWLCACTTSRKSENGRSVVDTSKN